MTFEAFGNLKTPVVTLEVDLDPDRGGRYYEYYTHIKPDSDFGDIETVSQVMIGIAEDEDYANINIQELNYVFEQDQENDMFSIMKAKAITPKNSKRMIIKDVFS